MNIVINCVITSTAHYRKCICLNQNWSYWFTEYSYLRVYYIVCWDPIFQASLYTLNKKLVEVSHISMYLEGFLLGANPLFSQNTFFQHFLCLIISYILNLTVRIYLTLQYKQSKDLGSYDYAIIYKELAILWASSIFKVTHPILNCSKKCG